MAQQCWAEAAIPNILMKQHSIVVRRPLQNFVGQNHGTPYLLAMCAWAVAQFGQRPSGQSSQADADRISQVLLFTC